MPSGRGLVVFAAGCSMWITARFFGSPGLAMVGVGIAILPFAAAFSARRATRRLAVTRRLSDVRVGPGTRVNVGIEAENRSLAPTSFLLLEDKIPSALGRPARLVLTGLPSRRSQEVSYTVLPQTRGRYSLGPMRIDVSDPFALSRRWLEFPHLDELLVTPEIEDLATAPSSPFGSTIGNSRAKNLFRTGEEFYTMREYHTGDDLRRLHWPSVAKTGELMIRQDETSRRSSALVFIDNRQAAIGLTHTPAFERAVSCAASVGVLLAGGGFSLRLATADSAAAAVTQDSFLDSLAAIGHTPTRTLGPALSRLRAGSGTETTLVLVAALPPSQELGSLIRTGATFGPKLAVFVYPVEPQTLPGDGQSQLEGRASQARLSLTRAGWDVFVLPPSSRLRDLWHNAPREPRFASIV